MTQRRPEEGAYSAMLAEVQYGGREGRLAYTIRVPYVSGLSEDLRRICRRYDIRTVFTTTSTLPPQFTRVKGVDPLLSRAGVVYKIPCSCGKEYIGETKRALGTRLKEHQAASGRGEVEKSAIAEHAWAEQHHPLWEEMSILEQADRDDVLRIKEAFCIATAEHQKSLNRDQGTASLEAIVAWKQQRVARQPTVL